MPKEELDLIQFAAGKMAEAGTGAPQVVRRQALDAGASRRRPDDVSQHLWRHAVSPDMASLVDRAEHRASVIAAAAVQASTAAFTHAGIGTVRMWPALPTRSAMTQCSSRCWIVSTRSARSSARRKPRPINIATIA